SPPTEGFVRALGRSGARPNGLALGLFAGDLLADLLQGSPDQARDVHLRDADLLGELRLRQAVEEAQAEDRPLALVEDAEARREDSTVLRDLVLVLLDADRLERVDVIFVVASAGARGQRERCVRATALERLEHV